MRSRLSLVLDAFLTWLGMLFFGSIIYGIRAAQHMSEHYAPAKYDTGGAVFAFSFYSFIFSAIYSLPFGLFYIAVSVFAGRIDASWALKATIRTVFGLFFLWASVVFFIVESGSSDFATSEIVFCYAIPLMLIIWHRLPAYVATQLTKGKKEENT